MKMEVEVEYVGPGDTSESGLPCTSGAHGWGSWSRDYRKCKLPAEELPDHVVRGKVYVDPGDKAESAPPAPAQSDEPQKPGPTDAEKAAAHEERQRKYALLLQEAAKEDTAKDKVPVPSGETGEVWVDLGEPPEG